MLVGVIALGRQTSHYMLATFTPSTAFIFANYLIFWLNPAHMSLRLFIATINLFAITSIFIHSICSFASQTLKSSDIFALICLTFTLLAFFENVLVEILVKNEERNYAGKNNWVKLDYFALIFYPVMFLTAVLIYCYVYVH